MGFYDRSGPRHAQRGFKCRKGAVVENPAPSPAIPGRRLRLSPQALAVLESALSEAAGVEPCGYLLGHARGAAAAEVQEAVAGRNVHPQPARGYRLDPEAHLAVSRKARARGLRVVGFWHAHLVGPPHPSRADLEEAPAFGPRLHLIVGKNEKGPPRVTAWRALQEGPNQGDFEEIVLEVM